jgi:hypothetical protein
MLGHTLARPSHRNPAPYRSHGTVSAVLLLLGVSSVVACRDDSPVHPTEVPPPARALAAAAAAATSAWRTVPSPNRGSLGNELRGVAAVSAADAWAVGDWNPTTDPAATPRRTLIERWNGSAWQIVPSPNAPWPGAELSTFESVAAVSGTAVWAVGHADDFGSLRSTTLIARWNGAQWTVVPSPNPAGPDQPNRLYDVAVVSANDVWAVGEQGFSLQGYPYRALILRWNGASWTNVPNNCGASLYGITAVGPTTLWAVGERTTCRYDGRSWVRVAPARAATFLDVAGVSPTLVWAVGREVTCGPYSCSAVSRIERWDGTRWTEVAHPRFATLNGVDAVTVNDAWAVGDSASAGGVLHWNGTAWTNVPVPRPGFGSTLNAVDALGATTAWAVGRYFDASGIPRTWTIRR